MTGRDQVLARVDREFAHAIDPAARKKRQRPKNETPTPASTYAGLHGQRRARRAIAGRKLPPVVVEVAGRVRAPVGPCRQRDLQREAARWVCRCERSRSWRSTGDATGQVAVDG